MDYVIGFVAGYFIQEFSKYLKRISDKQYLWDTEFEEWNADDLP